MSSFRNNTLDDWIGTAIVLLCWFLVLGPPLLLAGCACLPDIEDEGSALTCMGELVE